MYDYLLDQGITRVWAAPDQDRHVIIKPFKLSRPGGSLSYETILRRRVALPTAGELYYVYNIGELHPSLLNLFNVDDKWVRCSEAMTKTNIQIDIYSNMGVCLPRFECYYQIVAGKNLVLACKVQDRTPVNMLTEDLYVRFYSNAYFQNVGLGSMTEGLVTQGARVRSSDEILNLQQTYLQYKAKGYVSAWVNGFRVTDISPFSVKIGDVAEWIWDQSVYKTVELKISNLATFDSILDAKRKYVLQYPDAGTMDVDYHDDVDFFLVSYANQQFQRFKSVYIHRNMPDAVRQLTHRDYSITVPYVAGYVNALDGGDPLNYSIFYHIRKGGRQISMQYMADRVRELYKLTPGQIARAFTGVDSTVDFWKAENLENSAFNRVMSSHGPSFTKSDVVQAFGYNAIAKMVADEPVQVFAQSGQAVAQLPYATYNNSTVLEYDSNGLLNGVYPHSTGYIYQCKNPTSAWIEPKVGPYGTAIGDYYIQQGVKIPTGCSFRCYTCQYDPSTGLPNGQWTDVTDTNQYVVDPSGNLVWQINTATTYTLVRTDEMGLYYRFNYIANQGLIEFTLTQQMTINGNTQFYPMQVPMGKLRLWLNRRALIPGLDYFVDFPKVVIVNKTFLQNPTTQEQIIDVVFDGFCDSNLKLIKDADYGFVYNQTLSLNKTFNIRDDHVFRTIVNGQYVPPSQLNFSENSNKVTMTGIPDGSPYLVDDVVVPLRGMPAVDTYTLLQESKRRDDVISAYLGTLIKDPVFPNPAPIKQRYEVFSPLCSKLVSDLVNNRYVDPRMKQEYDDMTLMDMMKDYLYLLKFDPCHPDLAPDSNFVIVHPTNLYSVVSLDFYQYRLVTRVIKLLLNNQVQQSAFLTLH